MQSVLLTVFRTDSVEKINIWVSMRENLSPGRLKSAYSARILKKSRVASCIVCVLSLFLAVMWVSLETAIECFF